MDDGQSETELEPLHKNHDAYYVPGLHRGLLTLEMVARAQRPMSITEIAAELKVTRSSAFRIVYTLHHMGFLDEASQTKQYALGSRVLNIGFAYLASQSIIELARPVLEALRDETSVTAHLAIRDEENVLYLSCVQTRSGFLSNMNVGSRVPAYAAPMGWYLLSDLGTRQLAKLFGSGPFPALTERTPQSPGDLARTIAEVADAPFIVSRGILEAGGSSVAAPIFDNSGAIVAAIDISGPDSAFDLERMESFYGPQVMRAASRISASLGHSIASSSS